MKIRDQPVSIIDIQQDFLLIQPVVIPVYLAGQAKLQKRDKAKLREVWLYIYCTYIYLLRHSFQVHGKSETSLI